MPPQKNLAASKVAGRLWLGGGVGFSYWWPWGGGSFSLLGGGAPQLEVPNWDLKFIFCSRYSRPSVHGYCFFVV